MKSSFESCADHCGHPIRTIDPANADEVAAHDRIVSLVANAPGGRAAGEDSEAGRLERTLELHRQRAAAERGEVSLTDSQREQLEAEIEATDREIDEIVYGLYGLTEEEVAIVEGREG